MGGNFSLLSSASFSLNPKHSVFSISHALVDIHRHQIESWIIDTGATDHMINTISLFTSITAIISSHVKLPNGNYASVTHIGTVKISEHLILHDVLYVPSFSFNLISAKSSDLNVSGSSNSIPVDSDTSFPHSTNSNSHSDQTVHISPPNSPLHRSTRIRSTPSYLHQYHCQLAAHPSHPTPEDKSVLVNGKLCKNPSEATTDDFSYYGLDVPGNTSNQLGVHVNLITTDLMPGLNTLGISLARIDLAPNGGLKPPHYHPRGSEVLLVLEGTLYAGFVTSNPDHHLFTKILKPGDLFVFPFGLIHFQLNIGKTLVVAIAALTSQNPGVNIAANAIFWSCFAYLS
ncbi:hypothetical protein SADUNF_Sadunf04G0129000 [Salix dunnii]|uniref:Cupin type-1 domain-containing protein n=1 Tax=Salix dunnii TaxID=1413687 RepID=A0A835K9P5_9ROSI|nr:hypothetical protein SADUNF_Sadunf04G0129000 [Salix dunnii]